MLNNPIPENLLPKVSNRYELVNVIAKRARQLAEGAEPMVKTKEHSSVTIASLEFAEDKFKMIEKKEGKIRKTGNN